MCFHQEGAHLSLKSHLIIAQSVITNQRACALWSEQILFVSSEMAFWLFCWLACLSPRSLIKFPVSSFCLHYHSLSTQVENIPTASQRHKEHLCFCWLDWSIPITLYANTVQPALWLINCTDNCLIKIKHLLVLFTANIMEFPPWPKLMNMSYLFLVREQCTEKTCRPVAVSLTRTSKNIVIIAIIPAEQPVVHTVGFYRTN